MLARLYRDGEPRDRARALWLLARLPGSGARHLAAAARDTDPNIRIVALRATRRVGADVMPLVEQLVHDPSSAVRREVALSLRHSESPRAAAIWTDLAAQYDGRDRWYLEALGIAADRQWDRFFSSWMARNTDVWNTPGGRDIIWRARSPLALPMLEKLATDAAVPLADRLRYVRALDFHNADGRQRTLLSILSTPEGSSTALTPIILATLNAAAAKDDPNVKAALARTLGATRGTTQFPLLAEKYDARDQLDELVRLALWKPNETAGADAARIALAWGGAPRFQQHVRGRDTDAARRALSVLGRNFGPSVDSIVVGTVLDSKRPLALRKWAVQSMGNAFAGQKRLLALVQAKRLPSELEPAASGVLFSAPSAIRDSAPRYLTPPRASTLDGHALPPIMTLAARSGDAALGRAVFERTCVACHVVGAAGTDFGPPLSEIGDKLPKSGLLLAILDPSAGIGFGYEGYTIRLKDGQQLIGMISSETDSELSVKLIGGVQRRVPKSSVVERRRMESSLMQQGLERGMTEAELVHLVEYLSSLRRPR